MRPSSHLIHIPIAPHTIPPTAQIGISAPQGCGKTTIVEQLESLFAFNNIKAASVSIDDFYLKVRVTWHP